MEQNNNKDTNKDDVNKVYVQPSHAPTSREEIAKDAKGLMQKIKGFIKDLLDFREDTDQKATIEAIQNDIPLKGATAWILICSIFVASVGLNANSTAVVIGAMLISPLMGPILGVGLSIAINDIDTLRKSLINLATMIVLSLLTAFIFFYLFPLSEDTSELLGRTNPDIRDVLIAFFGGLALIIARTKKGTIASVIFGVAIATALMPPLCTVGYGLAKWAKGDFLGFQYAYGALYLFTINTIFIALATFIVLKLLGFTMIRYVNSAKRKFIARMASLLAVVAMIPAFVTFKNVYRDSVINASYNRFIKREVQSNNSLWLQREYLNTKEKTIELFFNGDITEATETDLRNELKSYEKIEDYEIVINANKARSVDRVMDAYDRAIKELDQKDNIITGLQKEITDLKSTITSLHERIEENEQARDSRFIPFSKIAKETKIRYNNVSKISFSKVLMTKDFINVDTIPQVTIQWKPKLPKATILKEETELRTWLQKEMKLDTLFIKRE